MVRAGIPEKVAMQISGVNERDSTDAAAKMDRHFLNLGILSDIPAENAEKNNNAMKPTSLLV
jgi:hypothetical protein